MVRVEPATVEQAAALAEGDDAFSRRFGVVVEPSWLGFEEARPMLLDAARRSEAGVWGLNLLFDDDGALVGVAGWKGRPIRGGAELGYAVAPGRRGRGIATAAVRELLSRAAAAGLRTAVAHTLAETSASTSVLRHCGFTKVSQRLDPEDGLVWRWELRLHAEEDEPRPPPCP